MSLSTLMDARWRAALCSLIAMALLCAAASASAQSTPPSAAATASALAADADGIITDFASQRDALGGWPNQVRDAYAALVQLRSQLEAARTASDAPVFRRRYRAFMRLAARITRWLASQYDPVADQVPSRDKVTAIVARLTSRLVVIAQVANQAGVTPNLTAANTALAQVESALANGTDAQLRMAVRALRDAIDAVQDALPDPEP